MPRQIAPPPSGETFQIKLSKPFEGTVSQSIEIIGEPNRSANVRTKNGNEEKTGDVSKDDVNELFSLISQIRGFPSSSSKDIYGLNTKLDLNTFEIQWSNDEDDTATAELGDETKQTFKEVVQSIEALARQFAKNDAAI
ncbi:hypothetical protein AMS68_007890 [Peltaster fructicola]|uniref:Uncharacterized protein n=1 Tax=Peltaster fructicola TaxID=286661 RepID=A0A6H0Y5U4_9PEZI|nr:hypothetical protein AMS68_007890 [Peltaster fructicola]